jgi:epidermal growth factor receptor substrate 15
LKAASGPSAGAGLMSSPVLSAQTLARQVTGGSMGIHNPAIARQMTGSLGMTSSPLAKQNTGGLSTDIPWEISPEEKAKFDRFFDQLDVNGDGVVEGNATGELNGVYMITFVNYISMLTGKIHSLSKYDLVGEEAGRFFMNSRLPEAVLAQIWDLSDITGTGSLTKDEFAVAMLLINRKNASNAPIPKTLPLSLVPPSLRNRVAPSLSAPLSFGSDITRSKSCVAFSSINYYCQAGLVYTLEIQPVLTQA